jgi:probable DNA repair protein
MPVSSQIKKAFAAGTTILTASVRTARWLRREYALERRRAGRRAWTSPPIEDWDTWLRNRWQERSLGERDLPLLLTSLQERRIWTRMLRADAEALVSPAGLTALAESAYARLSEYEAHAERRDGWAKTDAERFRGWAASFDRECARRSWMPRAQLEQKLAEVPGTDPLPENVLLVGFERTTPAKRRLLEVLAERGVRVEFALAEAQEAGVRQTQIEFVAAPGVQQEIAACARWVRARLEENPEARIAVLTPDLGAVRSDIERTFRRVLMPQTEGAFTADAMPFEFSLGLPLAEVPPIRAALLLLRWLHAPLQDEDVTWLLLSGYLLREQAELLPLAGLDAVRRKSGALSLEVSLTRFLRRDEGADAPAVSRLRGMRKAAEANRIAEEDRLPGRWTEVAQQMLRAGSWPGEGVRDPVHFQALRRWERALDEVALLDFDGQRMSYADFLKALEGHAKEVIFAPESTGAPVRVMGAMEAAGQQFDAVWFLSADDQSWPLRGKPHPLLPSDVQRLYGMPFADPENDLSLANAVTERIRLSAPRVVWSYAKRNKDGEMRPSPLLPRDAEWWDVEEPPRADAGPELESVEEAAEVAAWPSDLVAGGSEVLKSQAACPFQAFAKKRLCAEPLNRNEWGLSELERGSLLHAALERVWSPDGGALHTLEDLQAAVREGRLEGILSAAIAESVAKRDAPMDGWERAYLEGEKRRLLLRLKIWMEKEAERAPFNVIACEAKLDPVSVGELKLRLRVDRVDELRGSGRVLIDYKSSQVSVKGWEVPRPDEPQLPLYATFGGIEDLRGVLFGQIRADATCWQGSIASEQVPVLADGKKNAGLAKRPYDASRREAWETELRRLAGDFLRGEAAVDPKHGDKTCEHCGLQGLCRVIEVRGPLEAETEEDDLGDGDE